MLASKLLERAAATEGEACTHVRLNDAPFVAQGAELLPTTGVLRLVYVVTRPIDQLSVGFELSLGEPAEREQCLDLWMRELTTAQELWKDATYTPPGGEEATPLDVHEDWRFPEVSTPSSRARRRPFAHLRRLSLTLMFALPCRLAPQLPEGGVVTFEYTALLSCKRQDRGVFFSAPLEKFKFGRLAEALAVESLSDFERWSLIKMAASVNYFTSQQVSLLSARALCSAACLLPLRLLSQASLMRPRVQPRHAAQAKVLVEAMNYRKGKLDAAVLLYSRTVDPHAYGAAVLESLGTDTDRQALLDVINPPDHAEDA